jgi:hypothetical protein
MIGDIIYMNSGDWTETCSAIVENFDGTFNQLNLIAGEMRIERNYNPITGDVS